MDAIENARPRRLARILGALGLVNILAGAFALGVAPALMGAAGTQSHELLTRSGLTAHLLVTVANVPAAVIAYDLFKVVNRRLARLDMVLVLVATAVEAASLMGPQDQTASAYSFYTVFYGLDDFVVAYLIFNSTFLPRIFGLLFVLDGMGYLVNGFSGLLAPGFAAHLSPWVQLPILPAEGGLTVWLLAVGVNVERWKARARAAIRAWSLPLGSVA